MPRASAQACTCMRRTPITAIRPTTADTAEAVHFLPPWPLPSSASATPLTDCNCQSAPLAHVGRVDPDPALKPWGLQCSPPHHHDGRASLHACLPACTVAAFPAPQPATAPATDGRAGKGGMGGLGGRHAAGGQPAHGCAPSASTGGAHHAAMPGGACSVCARPRARVSIARRPLQPAAGRIRMQHPPPCPLHAIGACVRVCAGGRICVRDACVRVRVHGMAAPGRYSPPHPNLHPHKPHPVDVQNPVVCMLH